MDRADQDGWDRTEVIAADLLAACRALGLGLVTAESCTGGLIAAALTARAGSSDVFDRGWVTYSNASKERLLGVSRACLAEHGAVSEATARAMAEGALSAATAADDTREMMSLAVTGIAGPGGGTAAKPVGLVHLAAAVRGTTLHRRHLFGGDRTAVRLASAAAALELGLELARMPSRQGVASDAGSGDGPAAVPGP